MERPAAGDSLIHRTTRSRPDTGGMVVYHTGFVLHNLDRPQGFPYKAGTQFPAPVEPARRSAAPWSSTFSDRLHGCCSRQTAPPAGSLSPMIQHRFSVVDVGNWFDHSKGRPARAVTVPTRRPPQPYTVRPMNVMTAVPVSHITAKPGPPMPIARRCRTPLPSSNTEERWRWLIHWEHCSPKPCLGTWMWTSSCRSLSTPIASAAGNSISPCSSQTASLPSFGGLYPFGT